APRAAAGCAAGDSADAADPQPGPARARANSRRNTRFPGALLRLGARGAGAIDGLGGLVVAACAGASPGRPGMMKPLHAMIGGAQKAGTTSLVNYLAQHPRLCVHNGREL